MIYISVPYTGTTEETQERMECAFDYFVALAERGLHAISPVLVGHQLIKRGKVTSAYDFWLPYSQDLLERCDEVHVLALPNYADSKGVRFEVNLAATLGKNLIIIDPQTMLPHRDQLMEMLSVVSPNVS